MFGIINLCFKAYFGFQNLYKKYELMIETFAETSPIIIIDSTAKNIPHFRFISKYDYLIVSNTEHFSYNIFYFIFAILIFSIFS